MDFFKIVSRRQLGELGLLLIRSAQPLQGGGWHAQGNRRSVKSDLFLHRSLIQVATLNKIGWRQKLAPDIFQHLLATERCIVDVSREVERLARYIAKLESSGGDASRARIDRKSMRQALAALRTERDKSIDAIRKMNSVWRVAIPSLRDGVEEDTTNAWVRGVGQTPTPKGCSQG